MSTNCLVTKLKGVVDNSSLDKLGCVVLTCKSQGNNYIGLRPKSGGNITITILEGGTISAVQGGTLIDSTHAVINQQVQYTGIVTDAPNHNYKIEISNYYDLETIGALIGVNDVDRLNYSNLTSISVVLNTKANVWPFRNLTNFTSININGNYEGNIIEGDMSFISSMPNLTAFALTCFSNNNPDLQFTPDLISNSTQLTNIDFNNNYMSIFGDKTIAEYYGKLTNLTTLRLEYTTSIGTVEEFVAAQIANGRTTCESLNIGKSLGNATFKGYKINNSVGSANKILSWTSVNDISISGLS